VKWIAEKAWVRKISAKSLDQISSAVFGTCFQPAMPDPAGPGFIWGQKTAFSSYWFYFQRDITKNFKPDNFKTLQVSLIFAPQIFIPWLPNFPKKPISTGTS
jgi:hypothetical protein